MEDGTTSPVACAGCGSSSFITRADGVPICAYCRAPYTPVDPTCPRCGERQELGARRCDACGASLARECPLCGTLNPLMARQCLICGQTLSASDAMFARLTTRTPEQLRQIRETGARAKAEEQRASQSRMAQMWAEDDRRREAQARARAERERQERLIIAVAIGITAAVVVIAVIGAIIATRGPGLHF